MNKQSVFSKFPRTFWVANTIELFERWAWYGFFMLFANYLTGSADNGGLEFTQSQKGALMGIGTGILYFLPILTGAIADRFGYRRMLFVAFCVYTSAFLAFPHFTSFGGVFFIYICLAIGAALFKPIISATVAKTTTEETSSIGFGIFYMMVNIGAFFGPLVTLLFKDTPQHIFYISAGIVALNFPLLLLFEEPKWEKKVESIGDSIKRVFTNIATVCKDIRFVLFLLIIAGFWTMYNQLFFTLPVFISQWVDTSSLYYFFQEHWPTIATNYGVEGTNQLEAEFIVNSDAMFIIVLQIIISTLVMKWKPLRTMVIGFIVCSIGIALSLATQNVLFTLIAILIFSVGEMSSSPKITEYIGRIAPEDKKALYMGYSFIPVFLGNVFAGYISGDVYQRMADKASFVQQEITELNLELATGLSTNERFAQLSQELKLSPLELNTYLWDKYNPTSIWYVILGIGLFSAVALFVFDNLTNRSKK